jgi:outer membrane protein assembly factor BamB
MEFFMDRNVSPTTVPSTRAAENASVSPARLRLWPGVVLLTLQWMIVLAAGLLVPMGPGQFMVTFLTPVVTTMLIIGWWLFASRLSWSDRLTVVAVYAVAAMATTWFCRGSFPGMALLMYAIPTATTVWVGWLLASYYLHWSIRRTGLIVVLIAAWGFFTLIRFQGVSGAMSGEFAWRWASTAEEKLLAELKAAGPKSQPVQAVAANTTLSLEPGDWPSFRGPERDGRLTGVTIETDWSKNPPKEVWRHRIGPGWSSFAVVGTRLFTQEQRGEEELVVCYHTDTGEELWKHEDQVRFSEDVAGPGPRATPTFDGGKVYALGANGKLNCLDAITGKALWTRDVVADTGAKVPQWGLSSSPLVVEGIVAIFAGAPKGKSVAAYKIETGEPAWTAGEGEISYCSPQLSSIDGVAQILIATNAGLTAFRPASGEILWHHSWPHEDLARVVQPAVLMGGDVLLGTGMGIGTRRIHVEHKEQDWTTKEVWTSRAIKPYYNDMVVHEGHLYGFDSNVFMCVNLEDGRAGWKARGYGNGQVLLLADQGLLLILSEQGDVALVEANPKSHKELGRFKAIEGKTWNHPVVAHGKLFVRNGEEVACYQLREKGAEVAQGN